MAARELGEADGAVLRAEGYAEFARISREALRQAQGVVEDYNAMIRPWGFAPEDRCRWTCGREPMISFSIRIGRANSRSESLTPHGI